MRPFPPDPSASAVSQPAASRATLPLTTIPLAVFSLLAVPLTTLPLLASSLAHASAPVFSYDVVDVFPHDHDAFTQGLILKDGTFYESTGLYGESSLRRVEIATGTVLKQYDLPSDRFGEGMTALRDTLYQVTWQSHDAYAYVEQAGSFQLVDTFFHPWDGWGLTHDGTSLITTDGSSTVRYLDPTTKELLAEFQVKDDGVPVNRLNELEYVQGKIFANVWLTNRIVVFDALSGVVDAWLDLAGLADSVSYDPGIDVFNGIAWDPETNHLYVTGKLWPKLFEIEMPPIYPVGIDDLPTSAVPLLLETTPNPAGHGTDLRFVLPRASTVSLHVFDVRGRLVTERFEGVHRAGPQEMHIDTRSLPTGAYYLQLGTSQGSSTRKLQVIR